MTTSASLERPFVEVTPGEEATCLLEVRNDGPLVESYTTEVIGDAAAWTVVEPAEFSVYPGTSERVTLHFRPPRSAHILAGELAYAVRVTSVERPDDVAVPEGNLQILPFVETVAEIVPRTSRGRWGAAHEVSIDNRSNAPQLVTVGGSDPDAQLDLVFRPEQLRLGPGQAAFVKVKARPRKVLWQGFPVTHPFQVVVAPEDAVPATLDASTMQVPLLPRNLGRVLAALIVLALALAGLWWGLLRPAVQSAAKEATQEQIAPIERKAEEANTNAQKAAGSASSAAAAAGGGTKPPAPGGNQAPEGGNNAPPGVNRPQAPTGAVAFTRRFSTTVGNGSSRTDQYTVPNNRTLLITDIILQNPQGDEGRLDLIVDGATVLTVALNNFRDLDYHFVSPIQTAENRVVSVRVSCRRAGPALAGSGSNGQCRNFALLSGYLQGPQPTPTPTPTPVPSP